MPKLDPEAISAVLELPHTDGSFGRDQLRTLRKLAVTRKAVVLAFPPKAAGTFFRTAIVRVIGGQLVRAVHAQGGRDATPYLPTFVNYFSGGVTDKTMVAHAHMLALPANLHFLAAFAIKPIIIKRNIPDMLASYWDMLMSDNDALLDGLNCHIPTNFRDKARNAKADFIVDTLGPWYVNYYAGWLRQARENPDSVCLIDYRALKSDVVSVLQSCLEQIGMERSRQECELAVLQCWKQRHDLRYNKGEEGRGEAYFRPAQLNRLSRMIGHYPGLARHRGDLLETPQAIGKRR